MVELLLRERRRPARELRAELVACGGRCGSSDGPDRVVGGVCDRNRRARDAQTPHRRIRAGANGSRQRPVGRPRGAVRFRQDYRHAPRVDCAGPDGHDPLLCAHFRSCVRALPRRIYEAAELDGLSPLQIWRRVAWPLAKPAAFAVAVLAFAWHWSNFTDALLYISTEERSTLPLGLRDLYSLEPTNHPILLAGAVLVTLPPVFAFLSAQRAFFTRTLDV